MPEGREDELTPEVRAVWAEYSRDRARVELRNWLYEHYHPLAVRLATKQWRKVPKTVELDDLIQVASVTLLGCIETFKPDENPKFELYAARYIMGRLLDFLRQLDTVPRSVRKIIRAVDQASDTWEHQHGHQPDEETLSRLTGFRVDEIRTARARAVPTGPEPEDRPAPPPDNEILIVTASLAEFIDDMPEDHQLVLAMRYYEKQSIPRIASATGISETRVARMHAEAVNALRAEARRHLTEDPGR